MTSAPHRRPAPRPLTWRTAGVFLLIAALIYGVLVGVGLVLTRLDALGGLRQWDTTRARDFAAGRTPTMDTVTHYMSAMSDTSTAIAVTVVLVVAFRLWLGRWRESLVVLAAILGELTIFLGVTNSIGRARPEVPRLDPAPPTSSFPSGHTAAAVALYGCLAAVLLARMVHRRLALVLAVLCCAVPFLVAYARLYRGMHYVTDVTFGFLGGGVWLLSVLWLMLPRTPGSSHHEESHGHA